MNAVFTRAYRRVYLGMELYLLTSLAKLGLTSARQINQKINHQNKKYMKKSNDQKNLFSNIYFNFIVVNLKKHDKSITQ